MPSERHPIDESTIERALSTERMRSVPMGLHRKIEYRLRIDQLMAAERRDFRARSLAAAGIATAFPVSLAITLYEAGLLSFSQGIPGGLGFMDYFLASTGGTASWTLVAVLCGGALAAFFGLAAPVSAFLRRPH